MTVLNQTQNPDPPTKHLRMKVFEAKSPEDLNRALNRFLDGASIEACNYITHSLQDTGHRCTLVVVFGEPVIDDEPDESENEVDIEDDWDPPF